MADRSESARLMRLVRYWGALVIAHIWLATAFVLTDVGVALPAVAALAWITFAGLILFTRPRHSGGPNEATS